MNEQYVLQECKAYLAAEENENIFFIWQFINVASINGWKLSSYLSKNVGLFNDK